VLTRDKKRIIPAIITGRISSFFFCIIHRIHSAGLTVDPPTKMVCQKLEGSSRKLGGGPDPPTTQWLRPCIRVQQYGNWYTDRWWVGCYIWYSEEGPGRAAAPPRCTKCNSPPINGQCTNFILFDVAGTNRPNYLCSLKGYNNVALCTCCSCSSSSSLCVCVSTSRTRKHKRQSFSSHHCEQSCYYTPLLDIGRFAPGIKRIATV